MAKCKICDENILEGSEYCSLCFERNKNKTSESYLDSLLHSVIDSSPTTKDKIMNYSKDENDMRENKLNQNENETSDWNLDAEEFNFDNKDLASYEVDNNDVNEFDHMAIQFDLDEDINIHAEDLYGNHYNQIINNNYLDESKETEFIEQNFNNNDYIEKNIGINNNTERNFDNNDNSDQSLDNNDDTEHSIDNNDDTTDFLTYVTKEPEESTKEDFGMDEPSDISQPLHNNSEVNMREDQDINDLWNMFNNEEIHNNVIPEEINDFEEDNEFDSSLGNILDELDYSELTNQDNSSMLNEEKDLSLLYNTDQSEFENEENNLPLEDINEFDGINFNQEDQLNEHEDEFLNLFQQIQEDDPVIEDINAIDSLLQDYDEKENGIKNTPSDVADIFSDALKSVSSLEDFDQFELYQDDVQLPEQETKKRKKNKKEKVQEQPSEEKKPGLFARLFSNIVDEKSKEQHLKEIEKSNLAEEKKEAKKKKASSKKEAVQASSDEEENLDNGKVKNNKESKKASKKEQKEKKKKVKEVKEVIEDIEVDEGRINPVGASLVFGIFGVAVLLFIIGTNVFSYSISINNARDYFKHQKYTEAYKEVYGIDLKDEDVALFKKIETVMFVNKQLNSYNNFYALKQYPEALDSLLKGLSRYDKYIELATLLGVENDLDYVRGQIIGELNTVFQITEKEALKIMNSENQVQYSMSIHDIVSKKLANIK